MQQVRQVWADRVQHAVKRCGRKRSRDRRRVQPERRTGSGVAARDIAFLPLATPEKRTFAVVLPSTRKTVDGQ